MRNTYKHIYLVLICFISIFFVYVLWNTSMDKYNAQSIGAAVFTAATSITITILNFLAIHTPRLTTELNSIIRNVGDDVLIRIDNEQDLTVLRKYTDRTALTLNELEILIRNVKNRKEEIPSIIPQMDKILKDIQEILNSNGPYKQVDLFRFNQHLMPEVEYKDSAPADAFAEAVSEYEKKIEKLKEEERLLTTYLSTAEYKVDRIVEHTKNNRSHFVVNASLINSGKFGTSVRSLAILRVFIGLDESFDINLVMKSSDINSQIAANSTNIVNFVSRDVSYFLEEDRASINTYWGQAVRSYLIIEDVEATPYISNSISFAEGLYQKIIYGRLARAADILTKPH